MAAPSVHHVGIGVVDEKPVLTLFKRQLGFKIIATRKTYFDEKWVLQKDNITFVISKLSTSILNPRDNFTLAESNGSQSHPVPASCSLGIEVPHFSSLWGQQLQPSNILHGLGCKNDENNIDRLDLPQQYPSHNSNSVYEICLEVADVSCSLQKATACGAHILAPLTVVSSNKGEVVYATIQSCIGNVQHTILNTSKYHGQFLPGFRDVADLELDIVSQETLGSLSFDHITLCVFPNKTLEAICWYEQCFGMQRLIVNR